MFLNSIGHAEEAEPPFAVVSWDPIEFANEGKFRHELEVARAQLMWFLTHRKYGATSNDILRKQDMIQRGIAAAWIDIIKCLS